MDSDMESFLATVSTKSPNDFAFFSPADVLAPHPEEFESDLDTNLEGFNVDLPVFFANNTSSALDPFAFLRNAAADSHAPADFLSLGKNQYPRQFATGPPSTITASSASESYDTSSNYTPTNYSYTGDLDIEQFELGMNNFASLNLSKHAEYTAAQVAQVTASGLAARSPSSFSPVSPSSSDDDPHSFGVLPPASYSDYGGSSYSSSSYAPTKQHPSLTINLQPANVGATRGRAQSPIGSDLSIPSLSRTSRNVSGSGAMPQVQGVPRLPTVPSLAAPVEVEDPKRKHICAQCQRKFARAFNLKTHLETHNPHRKKDYICPVSSCRREFSRKHDLGRHRLSIHKGDPAFEEEDRENRKRIGIAAVNERTWCDTCGASSTRCACAERDVK